MTEIGSRKIILDLTSTELEKTEESIEEIKQTNEKQKITSKYHLPILSLNKKEFWPSQSVDKRANFTNEVAEKTCLGNCCGFEGLKSGCCTLDPEDLEHVLGPVDDDSIKKIIAYFKALGYTITRDDIVIDYEEGIAIGNRLFNGHPAFLSKSSYPMMRLQVNGPRFVCKFLNISNGKCTIYKTRPEMCRNYLCEYVKANFLVRKENTVNFRKIR